MMSNCSILRFDPRTGVSAAGEEQFSTGDALGTAGAMGGVRCFADEVNNSQRFTLGAEIKDAGRVLYVAKADWAALVSGVPDTGDHIQLQVDGEDVEFGQVLVRKDRVLGTLAHWELFLKAVDGD